jgi:hypothetical protein
MHPQFDLPTRGSISGRRSSITAAFFQAVTPVIVPTDAEVDEALTILGMSATLCVCAYCGDVKTEWDHFRAIVDKQRPTGYITEIANLVPACGKCNQSKGSKNWKLWMLGPARRSPAQRGVPELESRVVRLERFEAWRTPKRLDYAQIIGPELWDEYLRHWRALLDGIAAAQIHAELLRKSIEQHLTAGSSD